MRPLVWYYRASVDDAALFEVLRATVRAVRTALESVRDMRATGDRPGQYALDLVADAAAVEVLHGAGLDVLSEESGVTSPNGSSAPRLDGLLAVLDPVDGSTNASLGLPWFATSICVLDDEGPRIGLVVNLATGVEYRAQRGGGARRDGRPIRPSTRSRLDESVIGVSGLPARWAGWAQFRALGAASLDMCAVAEGILDGYLPVGGTGLHSWDYLAALLVCREAGAFVDERSSLDLTVRDDSPRRPVAAATRGLLGELLAVEI